MAGEMFIKAALSFVGEPATGTAETKVPGDGALDGPLVRRLDGIDDSAQKAAPREDRLSARTICRGAGRDEIPIEQNTIHG